MTLVTAELACCLQRPIQHPSLFDGCEHQDIVLLDQKACLDRAHFHAWQTQQVQGLRQMKLLSIGELSEQVGCTVETIRYYEQLGLIPPPSRTKGGHRQYGLRHLQQLRLIRRCRELGFALKEVHNLVARIDRAKNTCTEVRGALDARLDQVQGEKARLEDTEQTLRRLVEQCSGGHHSDCPALTEMLEPTS